MMVYDSEGQPVAVCRIRKVSEADYRVVLTVGGKGSLRVYKRKFPSIGTANRYADEYAERKRKGGFTIKREGIDG